MSRCDHCGAEILGAARFTCNFCEENLCGDHRLPEAHNCVTLRASAAAEAPLQGESVLGKVGDEESATRSPSGVSESENEAAPCERCGDHTTREQYCRECAIKLVNETPGPSVTETKQRQRQASIGEESSGAGVASRIGATVPSVPRPGRRSFLLGLGAVVGGGAWIRRDQIAGAVGNALDEQQLASAGIERLEWEGATLVLELDPTFDTYDGWVIYHEYEDPQSYRVASGEYPRVENPLRMPFDKMLLETGQEYSTRSFRFTAFDGMFNPWRNDRWGYNGAALLRDEGPTVDLEAPEEAVPSSVQE